MTAPEMKQSRLEWLTDDLKTSETGEYLLFVGCLPYFDAYFDELKLDTTNIARSAIHVLNKLGISPVLSSDERCCGHDLFWSGEDEMFSLLAKRNAEAIAKTGARKIITTCAECYTSLKNLYPRFVDFPYEVFHFSQFIAELPVNDKVQLVSNGVKATYHDPCRLSRHANIIDEPRKILTSIDGLDFNEMLHSGKRSNCCGTSSWMSCSMYSKMLQAARLKEAKDTGANLLITACPKCMIHFKCAQKDAKNADELAIEIKDLAEVISEAMT
jgi:Fe-S oxidoreductase